jgi:2Fe-2S ferredoxin
MPKITVLPHTEYCPHGAELDAEKGETVLDVLLRYDIAIEHACEMQCACTTCHVYLRNGYNAVAAPLEKEDEMLDRAWGLDMDSRLSCQARVGDEDLVVEIPKYTLNQVSEGN